MGIKPIAVGITGMVIYMLLQVALVLEFTEYSKLLWGAYAFFSTSGVITYAVLSQSFKTELAGRVNTGLNLLVFVMAFFMQWGAGYVINQYASSRPDQYDPAGYQMAFGILIALQVVAMVWYLFNRKLVKPTNAV